MWSCISTCWFWAGFGLVPGGAGASSKGSRVPVVPVWVLASAVCPPLDKHFTGCVTLFLPLVLLLVTPPRISSGLFQLFLLLLLAYAILHNILQWSSLSLRIYWALLFQACPAARLSHVRNLYERLSKTNMTNIWLLAAIKHVFDLRQAWTSMLASFPKIINNVSWVDRRRESWEAICLGIRYCWRWYFINVWNTPWRKVQ